MVAWVNLLMGGFSDFRHDFRNITKKGWSASGMQKYDWLRVIEPSCTDMRKQARHRLACVNGVKQNALTLGNRLKSVYPGGSGITVAFPNEFLTAVEIGLRDRDMVQNL